MVDFDRVPIADPVALQAIGAVKGMSRLVAALAGGGYLFKITVFMAIGAAGRLVLIHKKSGIFVCKCCRLLSIVTFQAIGA